MDTKQLVAKARESIVDAKEYAWVKLWMECAECQHEESAFDEMHLNFDIDEVMQDLVSYHRWTFIVRRDPDVDPGVEWLCPKCSDPEWQPPEGFLKSEGGE